jgi:hypothetical protein
VETSPWPLKKLSQPHADQSGTLLLCETGHSKYLPELPGTCLQKMCVGGLVSRLVKR